MTGRALVTVAARLEDGRAVGVVTDVSVEADAGVGGPSTTVIDTDPTAFRRVLDVNLVGAFLMARAVGRVLVEQGTGGAIVNLGSILGQRAEGHDAAYAASKGGIAMLTQALARELAPHRVRVNTIAPGYMAPRCTGSTCGTWRHHSVCVVRGRPRTGTRVGTARASRDGAGRRGRCRVALLGRRVLRNRPFDRRQR